METCLFFGIILLMYFCNINGFIQIIFFVDIVIFLFSPHIFGGMCFY